jgi:3-methyladenine DNA glycosylase AlkD
VSYRDASAALHQLANPAKARLMAGFFKTGKGEYGEGDQFLGLTVPAIRAVATRFRDLGFPACRKLLQSSFNDERLLALMILVEQYRRGDKAEKIAIHRLYLAQRERVNNWNLVDSSASYIVGAHLLERDRTLLKTLARSRSLWDRRIAMVATLAFIRRNEFADTLALAEQLLDDDQDLMHKACGWMLREVGKRDEAVLQGFLKQHHRRMPRTMLRYAIERLAERERRAFLAVPRSRAGGR